MLMMSIQEEMYKQVCSELQGFDKGQESCSPGEDRCRTTFLHTMRFFSKFLPDEKTIVLAHSECCGGI